MAKNKYVIKKQLFNDYGIFMNDGIFPVYTGTKKQCEEMKKKLTKKK